MIAVEAVPPNAKIGEAFHFMDEVWKSNVVISCYFDQTFHDSDQRPHEEQTNVI